jgi:ribonuclease R
MSKKKKSKTKGNKLPSRQLQREIIKLFRRQPKKRLNPKQVSKKLKVANNRDSIQHALSQLTEKGQLAEVDNYKYTLKRGKGGGASRNGSKHYEGFVDMTRTGDAYVICEGLENDVHVSAKYMNTAMHGDRVRIRVWTPRGRRRREGEVAKVLERASEHFLGTLWVYPNYAIVVPEGNLPIDILVDLEHINEASDGDKVIVKITEWGTGEYKNPKGKVTTVLGKAGSHDIEMKAILINNGFDLTFPENVMKETAVLPGDIREEEITRRLDLRDVTTFTIDPESAKDFDDALSIRYLDNGDCEVGVHIADVSHYIRPGFALDKEGFRRSTSVYLVDRVLPMLPERLSNELCSLRPKEDKLTFSAIFTFNKNGKVVRRWFGKTVIHSDQRFTYEQAQEVIESGKGDFSAELQQLNKLAKKLRKEKFKKGAINFETDEVNFRLDENGAPVDIYVKERKDSHMLIEDFMLLANREVATFIANKGKKNGEIPFVYRIHDEPDPEKVQELARFAKEMGFDLNITSPKDVARSYNRLIEAAKKEPGLKLLEPLAIRTMSKAEYSTDNIGHYGLAFDNYTHFTSPIRRYSDVLVHRILEKNLERNDIYRVNKTELEAQCRHISMQERKAMDAERESVKYKQVEFIENHIGEMFKGYISGILDRGIFVELEGNRCEGLVDFSTMEDHYEVMSGKLRVQGRKTGKILKMGDAVKVRILRTDLARRQIDMEWVGTA